MAEQENETTIAGLEAIKAILTERWGQESTFKEFFDVVLVAAIVNDIVKKMPAPIDWTPTRFTEYEVLQDRKLVAKSKSKPMPEESEDVYEYIARIEQIRKAMKRNQKEIDQLKAETRSLISELLAA